MNLPPPLPDPVPPPPDPPGSPPPRTRRVHLRWVCAAVSLGMAGVVGVGWLALVLAGGSPRGALGRLAPNLFRPPPAAPGSAAAREQARELFNEGNDAEQVGDYPRAAGAFTFKPIILSACFSKLPG